MASLDHVTISAVDFARSLAFYDAALGALGLVRLRELVDEEEDEPPVEAAAWGPANGEPIVWLVASAVATHRSHLALRATSRAEVETFFASAVANGSGGRPHSAPRRWPIYRRGEFNAIVADPDGNLVEAVCAE